MFTRNLRCCKTIASFKLLTSIKLPLGCAIIFWWHQAVKKISLKVPPLSYVIHSPILWISPISLKIITFRQRIKRKKANEDKVKYDSIYLIITLMLS